MKKRTLALFTALIMAGSLTACSGGKPAAAPLPEAAGAAEAYPSKTVEVIVPFGAGGGADVATRLLCSYLEKELGQTFIINNVSGGGGSIGLTQLANANPDGYTIAYFSSTDSNGDLLYEGVGYNKDSFTPICQFAADPHILIASQKSGITDIRSLLEAGTDGSALWGIGGAWTHWDFLKMEFEKATGTSYKRLVFDGGATAVNNVAGGDCAVATPFISEALAQIEAGNVVPIAVTSTERSPMAPGVPTLSESGIDSLESFESVMWRGFVAPAGTPDEIAEALADAVGRVCENEEFLQKAQEAGVSISFKGAGEFKIYYEENHRNVREMIESADFEK